MSYVPPHFRVADEQTLVEFMQAHDFATIVSSSADGLVASHIPVLVRRAGERIVIAGHMARANQHWRLMDGETPAIFIFHGPHGYVSPTWYEAGPAVPTWNYGVVHAHGLPQASEDETFLRGVLEELVRRYEGHRVSGWRIDSVPADFYNQLRRGIVGFEMAVTKLDGKFKLGQNRSAEDRRRTIAELERSGSAEAAGLAELMRHRSGAGG
jgi:transcriptional regulator